MSILAKYTDMLHKQYMDTGLVPGQLRISTKDFIELENELKPLRMFNSSLNPIGPQDEILINFAFGSIVFKKHIGLDILDNPVLLERNPYNTRVRLDMGSTNCAHQFVNVGFTSEKYVCKVCNKEQT